MRRINKKQFSIKNIVKRSSSQNNFSFLPTKTLAQINHVTARDRKIIYHTCKPYRILLPDYFNIPKFTDETVIGGKEQPTKHQLIGRMRAEIEVRRKLRDLDILAEGMRRAKNIKQQSRYYFTQGVLLHNNAMFQQSIAAFQKFLKIVLFIRDDKSVELALNTIGVQFMHLKRYQKAIEYHKKQGEINERADQFASHVNIGICYELSNDFESALKEYRDADRIVNVSKQESKKQYVKRLVERVEVKVNSMFLTAESKESKAVDIQEKKSYKEQLNKSISLGKLNNDSRVEFGVHCAQEKMQDFLIAMKNSFVLEKK